MTKQKSFQELSAELDDLLARLQSGELGVDDALPAYERGLKLVTELEAQLETAQNKITEIAAERGE